jgi:tetraprenyl-beta-curcumene synthase
VLAGRRGRLAPAAAFAGAACRYWLEVFPQVNRELGRWRARAETISDPRLRSLALSTQREERGNLEGAASFAVLVPRPVRGSVIRAAVGFQALYDYLDTLAEQPTADPVAHARSLHLALRAALGAPAPVHGGPGTGERSGDAGYIAAMIAETRAALGGLPSWQAVAGEALCATERMVSYQSLIHGGCEPSRGRLEHWARGLTPPGSGLHWWETAAGAASSLGVFALLAAAAAPALEAGEAAALREAYFPWIGALHVLLDSLVDRDADLDSGHHSLIAHYSSPEQTAARLGEIATRARTAALSARQGEQHALILAAMAGFYLSRPAARAPAAAPACERVLKALGAPAAPAIAVLQIRRRLDRLPASPTLTNSSADPVS